MAPEVTTFRSRRSRGFTLIEIMVVVAIIIVLVAISIGVGSQVKALAAKKYTATTLTTLNNLMRDYLAPENGGNPEPGPTLPYAPIAPAVVTSPQSDAVNWVKALSAFPKTANALNHLTASTDTGGNKTILDGLGTPIVYVQSSGTAQGYFWSAGADRVFGTQDDLRSTDAP